MQHLVCFAGGMVGIGAKSFEHREDLDTARKLVDGSIWAYESMENGLITEIRVSRRLRTGNVEGM